MTEKYIQTERSFVRMFLFFTALVLAHFVRIGWIHYAMALASGIDPGTPEPVYRIAIPAAQAWLAAAFHVNDATLVAAAIDFACAFAAFHILYLLLVHDALPSPQRPLAVSLFLAFLAFPCTFVVPWQRPETLPSTLYIALSLFCLQRANRNKLWIATLFLATAIQSFVRADIPFVLGVAVVLLRFPKNVLKEFGTGSANLIRGLVVVTIAGGVQAYLQLVRYRDVPYKIAGPISHNLHAHNLNVFVIALLPFCFVALLGVRQRIALTAVEATAVCASLLYLPLWVTLGKLAEVRIFVPFLFALCIVAARISASYLLPNETLLDSPHTKTSVVQT